MPTRNTVKLKQLIFDTLNNDVTLRNLLGGAGKISHANPLDKTQYPCVVYDIVMDSDEPFFPDVGTGIVRSRLMIQIFSDKRSVIDLDKMNDRVYTILHGKKVVSDTPIVYSCYRVSSSTIFEPPIAVWRVESRYDVVNGFSA